MSSFGIRTSTLGLMAAACVIPGLCFARAAGKTKASHEASAPEHGGVKDIRFWSSSESTRIAVEVTSSFKLKSDRLHNPERLFFDIVGVRPENPKTIQVIRVGDSLLKQIRVAETQAGVTRIVLDLAGPVEFDSSQLTSPERLMIELRKPGPGKKPSAVEPSLIETSLNRQKQFVPPPSVAVRTLDLPPARIDVEPPKLMAKVTPPSIPSQKINVGPPPASRAAAREALRPIPAREPAIPVSTPAAMPATTTMASTTPAPVRMPVNTPATPAKRPSSGEDSMTRVLGLKLGRVVIDAGHGGHDGGTHGPGGLLEKDLVLDVAKRLAVLVETRMGAEVILTRSDDTFIPLEQRPAIANQAHADLFISVHANSSPVRTISGVETYYLSFTTSKTALEVAARENAASERTIADLRDLVQQIALKEKVEESREFASKVQNSLATLSVKTSPGAKDRGVKKAPFVVLIGAQMPAILAEIGFVTNIRDEQMMRKAEYRQKIADALFRGVSGYASGLSHFQVARSKSNSE